MLLLPNNNRYEEQEKRRMTTYKAKHSDLESTTGTTAAGRLQASFVREEENERSGNNNHMIEDINLASTCPAGQYLVGRRLLLLDESEECKFVCC